MSLAIFSQLGIMLLTVLVSLHAKKNKKILLFLFLGIDAFFFEVVTQRIFKEVLYDPSLWNIWDIPMMVVFGWATLLYSYLELVKSKSIFVKAVYISFVMALIDLIMEKPAVTLGFWTWRQSGEYFGIPFMNFFAWFIYSFLVVITVSKKGSLMINNVLPTFISVSSWGLGLGFLWNMTPLNIQKIMFGLIMAISLIVITINKKYLAGHTKSKYLIITPLSFVIFSLGLTIYFQNKLPKDYIFLTGIFFLLWIALTIFIDLININKVASSHLKLA